MMLGPGRITRLGSLVVVRELVCGRSLCAQRTENLDCFIHWRRLGFSEEVPSFDSRRRGIPMREAQARQRMGPRTVRKNRRWCRGGGREDAPHEARCLSVKAKGGACPIRSVRPRTRASAPPDTRDPVANVWSSGWDCGTSRVECPPREAVGTMVGWRWNTKSIEVPSSRYCFTLYMWVGCRI